MPDMLQLQLTAGPDAASEARIALGELELGLGAELLRDVRLMTSELVTNSIRHAGVDRRDTVVVRAWLRDDHIGIEVADGGPGFEPVVTAGREPEPGGWGLFIVQGLADRWGTLHRDGMSRVWFEIDIRDRRYALRASCTAARARRRPAAAAPRSWSRRSRPTRATPYALTASASRSRASRGVCLVGAGPCSWTAGAAAAPSGGSGAGP